MELEALQTEKLSKSTIGFALYLFLLPLDFINIGFGSVSKLLSLLVVAITLLSDLKKMNFSFGLLSLMALYICWNIFSVFSSANTSMTLGRITSLVLNYAFIMVCGSCVKTEKELKFLEKAIVLSGWLVLVLMLFYSRVTNEFRVIIVANGQEQDPNELCGFLMFSIIFYLKNILHYKRPSDCISLIIMMLFVFLTGSRGGMSAILIAGFSCYLFENSAKGKIRNSIFLVLVILIIYMLLMEIMPEELMMRFDLDYTSNDHGAGRFNIWRIIIEQYAEFDFSKKFCGIGAATTRLYTPTRHVAHNLWIETLFELGIIGLTLLVLLYFAFARRACIIKSKMYLFVLIGFFIMTLTLSLPVYKPIYILFTMINLNYKFEMQQEKDLLEYGDDIL